MTQDEIIEMAREAGVMLSVVNHWPLELKKFAELAAAKEREACAKLCDDEWNGDTDAYEYSIAANDCAAAIRARGQA
jgi:hypothetical protein